MRTRRHHNNKGERQIRRGKTRAQVAAMARRMGIKYGKAKWNAAVNEVIHLIDKAEAELNQARAALAKGGK